MSSVPDLVIFEVLKYLERDDLPRCRAVSKRLHALITPVFADRLDEFQVILDPKPGFDEILCQLFLEEQDASRLKYSNFFFRDMDMTTPICAVLFSAMGLNMSKLKLKFKDDSTALSRGMLADILRNKAPFLEELSIKGLPTLVKRSAIFSAKRQYPDLELRKLSFKVHFESPYSPEFLTSLFKSSRKLESLNIGSDGYDVQMMGKQILTSFSEHGNMAALTELTLGQVTEEMMTLLANKFRTCPLKNFDGRSDSEDDFDPDDLDEFLRFHSPTLETLKLSFGQLHIRTFPAMENLRNLTIRVEFGTDPWWDYWVYDSDDDLAGHVNPNPYDFDWGMQFPNLVTLVLDDPQSSWPGGFNPFRMFKLSMTPCPSLKNLQVPPDLGPDAVTIIGHIFPNVLKLVVPLQSWDEVIAQLWTTWPHLKALVLSTCYFWNGDDDTSMEWSDGDSDMDGDEEDLVKPDSVEEDEDKYEAASGEYEREKRKREKRKCRKDRRWIDSLLTGIPNDGLRAIRDAQSQGTPFSQQGMDALITFPSLLNLQGLEHLIFYDHGWNSRFKRQRSRISDLSVDLVLSKMRELKSLHVSLQASKITSDGLATLCTALDLKQNNKDEEENHGYPFHHLVKYDWQLKYKNSFDISKLSIPDYE